MRGLIWVLASVVRDKDLAGDEDVSTNIELILGSYVKTRESERFGSTGAIPDAFQTLETLFAASEPVKVRPSLRVVVSYGRGNWANVPWIAFLDDRETSSTQRGTYVVFLFKENMDGAYIENK